MHRVYQDLGAFVLIFRESLLIMCPPVQKNTCRYLVLAVFAALTSGAFCLGKEDTPCPEAWLAQARKLEDIWSYGTPAVKVRTEIEILGAKGKTTRGKYVVNWISPSRWREELEIADYKRLRVHDSKGYWQQSSLSVQPEIIFQIDSILDYKTVLKVGGKQGLGKVKTRDKTGVRQKCTEVKWMTGTERVLCFDEANGTLLSVEYPSSDTQNPPVISRVEYGVFNKLGDKRIPYETHAFHDRTVVVTTKVTDVMPITDDRPALFAPPANSEFWPQCDDMLDAELLNRVQPKYPTNARENGERGRVVFYAVIEADGALSHLTLIERATAALESSAADAIRQWHYKPASCGPTPIRVETSIPVDFWLQRY
jgi:TonB family protein